ncbi:MAG: hypothetical protein A4E57_04832 [Syntrophorhabdaceae bacterium PtaU1.Bin034]|nr:MAG: hypothetical protein A4E57_04832 [Syntrophorhabdaceae bacterium PtaU1.Bin034]
MEISKYRLALLKQRILPGKRFLDLYDHLCPFEDFLVGVHDFGTRRGICLVLNAAAQPGALFYEDLVASLGKHVYPGRHHTYPVLRFLDLFRHSYYHCTLLWRVVGFLGFDYRISKIDTRGIEARKTRHSIMVSTACRPAGLKTTTDMVVSGIQYTHLSMPRQRKDPADPILPLRRNQGVIR